MSASTQQEDRAQALEVENAALHQKIAELQAELEAVKLATSGESAAPRAVTDETDIDEPDEQDENEDPNAVRKSNFADLLDSWKRKEAEGTQVDVSSPDGPNIWEVDAAAGDWDAPLVKEPSQQEAEPGLKPEPTPCLQPCRCPICLKIVREEAAAAARSLEQDSRLFDTTFFRSPPGWHYLPFKRQTYYLTKALSVAQDTLWNALQEHWPNALRGHYLEGPQTILFGRGDLTGCFGNTRFMYSTNELCDQPPAVVFRAMGEVVALRNAVCHQHSRTARQVDALMKTSQALAVTLLDEKRAFKVRRLRYRLMQETQASWNQILASERLLQNETFRTPIHHQVLYAEICRNLDQAKSPNPCFTEEQCIKRWGGDVIRIAEKWCALYGSPETASSRIQATYRRREIIAVQLAQQAGNGDSTEPIDEDVQADEQALAPITELSAE